MKIGIMQFDLEWENKEKNKAKIKQILEKKQVKLPTDILIFPEMTLTGFSMHKKVTTLNNKDIQFFQEIAQKYQTAVFFGGSEKEKNICWVIDKSGKILGKYEKINLFTFANEDKNYLPGKTIKTFNLSEASITPFICYDLRFPKIFWQQRKKTDIYIIIANWPTPRSEHWKTFLKARAIENQAFVIGVNRIGKDPNNSYSGDSLVYNPIGREIFNCQNQEDIFVTDIRLKEVSKIRETFPVIGK
jgi:predicted amidohydrolase